jgi:thioredoxin-like negative regulator of GroEL
MLLVNTIINIDKENSISDNPLDAAYNRAIRLIVKGNYPAAMDGLIDIVRENKNYHNGEPRLIR